MTVSPKTKKAAVQKPQSTEYDFIEIGEKQEKLIEPQSIVFVGFESEFWG